MNDPRDLKDLTIHDVRPISDDTGASWHPPSPELPPSHGVSGGQVPCTHNLSESISSHPLVVL